MGDLAIWHEARTLQSTWAFPSSSPGGRVSAVRKIRARFDLRAKSSRLVVYETADEYARNQISDVWDQKIVQFQKVISEELWPGFGTEAIVRVDGTDAVLVVLFEEFLPRSFATHNPIEVG